MTAIDMDKANSPLTFGIVPLSNFTLSAFAGFLDVLRLAADTGDGSRQRRCRWTVMSSQARPVRASCGTLLTPDSALKPPESFDYLVVVGGLLRDAPQSDAETDRYLVDTARSHVPLVGLCTAVFTLLRLGLMSGYQCCISWFHYQDLKNEFPDVTPVADQLYVVDGERITCAGGTAAIDVSAWLVQKHIGFAESEKALNILQADGVRSQSTAQPHIPPHSSVQDVRLQQAINIIEENLAEVINVNRLAAQVGLSRRQLERLFRNSTGMSPSSYMLERRIHQGHWLLTRTRVSITRIAHACGFTDSSHFARHIRAAYGTSPRSIRDSASEAPAPSGPL